MSETLRIGSLFSGYGGLDMAARAVLGGSLAWVADIEPGPCKLLANRHPTVPNLGDVTAVDWTTVEPVDVICGGSPCQDLSTAGRRAGMRPGTRSGLWESMREAIAIIQPTYVVWENVRGALSAEAHSDMVDDEGRVGDRAGGPALRALGRVLGDLADLGYDTEWRGVRASDVGACHQRYRIFLLARRQDAADAYYAGLEGRRPVRERAGEQSSGPGRVGPGVTLLPTPTSNLGDNGGPQDPAKRRAGGHSVSIEDAIHGLKLLPTVRTENNENRQSDGYGGKDGNYHGLITGQTSWGDYAAAIARWETVHGPAPEPTEPGRNGPRLSPRFTEWLMGLEPGWITDVPGITRTEALRMCGNGVVSLQAATAISDCMTAFKEAA